MATLAHLLKNKKIPFLPNAVSLLRSRLSRSTQRCLHLHFGEHFTRGSLKEIQLRTSVPLAGRKYLPSSEMAGFPKYLCGPRENYPLLVKATKNGQQGTTTLTHWAKRCREIIDQAYSKYDQDGSPVAILFRGLGITNEQDLSVWTKGLGYDQFAYVGGTGLRSDIAENVAEGALDDKEFTIAPHNELSYSVRYPKVFVMGYFKKPSWGGETAICDVREIHAKLDPSFVEKCKENEIRYWHFLPDENSKQNNGKIYQSWQGHYKTGDHSKAADYLRENGHSYAWDEDGGLFYWNDLPPFIEHPRSGEKLWFNQVTETHFSYHVSSPLFEGVEPLPNKKYPFHTTYGGDGEEIEQRVIDEHRRVTWESAVGFHWNNGDVLFLDQLIVQHSRLGYEGERNVGITLLNY